MVIGFTGTRQGMNEQQLDQLARVLITLRTDASGEGHGTPAYPPLGSNAFHFGGAHGADLTARKVAKHLGFEIDWHPTYGVALDALADEGYATVEELMTERWHGCYPPLVRNHHIVNAVSVLVAAPLTDKEQQRSGTWATIRYARYKHMPIVMLSRGIK